MYTAGSVRCSSVVLALCSILFCGAQARADVFADDFNDDQIAPDVWAIVSYGSGAQVAEVNQHLEFSMPAAASGTEFGTRLVSRFLLRGDFDIQVDFSLLQWPYYNGVRTAIGLTDDYDDDYGVERSSLSASEPLGAHEVYVADFGPFVLVPTLDFTGKLRLVRSGPTQTGYYHSAGGWIPILTDSAPTSDIAIQLHAWSHDYAFQHHDVRAAFDNFSVTTGQVIWPDGAAPWVTFRRKLAATFGASRLVQVSELQNAGGGYVVNVTAQSLALAEALEFVLLDEYAVQGVTVTIRVLDPQGYPVTSLLRPADATVEQTRDLMRIALGGNLYPMRMTIGELPFGEPHVMVETQAKVISFWDANGLDPNGYDHFVAAAVFNELVDRDLEGLFFTSIRASLY